LKSAKKSKELEREEKKYEKGLKDGIEHDIWSAEQDKEQEREEKEFQRKLKEDPEFRDEVRQREENNRQQQEYWKSFRSQASKPEPEIDWRQLRQLKNPPAADVKEFASLGRRAAANKYHPDRGGDSARMAQLNQVADWLESLAGAA
jgi:hypothetical protein